MTALIQSVAACAAAASLVAAGAIAATQPAAAQSVENFYKSQSCRS